MYFKIRNKDGKFSSGGDMRHGGKWSKNGKVFPSKQALMSHLRYVARTHREIPLELYLLPIYKECTVVTFNEPCFCSEQQFELWFEENKPNASVKKIKSREITREELREHFIRHVWSLINYWDNVNDTSYEKLNGLVHSLLATIDGSGSELPAFVLAPLSTEEDKQWLIDDGKNYYPTRNADAVKCDIAGGLHEILYSVGRKTGLYKENK